MLMKELLIYYQKENEEQDLPPIQVQENQPINDRKS